MFAAKSETVRRGIVLRTADGKYLSEDKDDLRHWGPALVATPHLEHATVFPNDRWTLDAIEQRWAGRVNVLDRVAVAETVTRVLVG